MASRIRVLYVVQGITPTGPGRHLYKLLAYRDQGKIDARVFAFDYCDPAMMATLERDYAVQWESLGMRFTRPLTYWHGIPRLLAQIDEFRPHIIQTHHTPIVDWVARLVTRWRHVPLNLSRAVTKPKPYQLSRNTVLAWWFIHLGDSLTSPLVDYYLPNSLDVAHYMREVEGVPLSKLLTILNGVDTEYFAYSEALRKEGRQFLGADEQAQLVVNVGPLRSMKRQDRLVGATLELMPAFPRLRVVFVGKTWSEPDEAYVEALKQTIAHAGLSQRFIFTGELQDVRSILAAADIYAQPSIVEGSSNAILEAMSMGRACVVTDIPSCQELIIHGEGGLVVPQDDKQQLVDALSLLLSDDAMRACIGAKSRRQAVERYSVHRMCAELEAVYRQGLEKKRIQLPA